MSGYAVRPRRADGSGICQACGGRLRRFQRRRCDPCWELLRQQRELARTTGPNLVAHGGGWHPVAALPRRLPCCGGVLGEEDAP